jgi:hypothetical protein
MPLPGVACPDLQELARATVSQRAGPPFGAVHDWQTLRHPLTRLVSPRRKGGQADRQGVAGVTAGAFARPRANSFCLGRWSRMLLFRRSRTRAQKDDGRDEHRTMITEIGRVCVVPWRRRKVRATRQSTTAFGGNANHSGCGGCGARRGIYRSSSEASILLIICEFANVSLNRDPL